LGDAFMEWGDDSVLSFDTYVYSGEHMYHAMILAGYDDSKGTNGAFLVVNSWGEYWGNSGTIWVDYNFFTGGEFCFAAFVAKNKKSDADFEPDDTKTYDPPSGADLLAWSVVFWYYVYPDYPDWLGLGYEVYNVGETNVSYTQDWSITFVYYSAYDANDYGVITYDYFSDYYAEGEITLDLGPGYGYVDGNNWHMDFPTGEGLYRYYDQSTGDHNLKSFLMPSGLNGYYYLVVIADGFDNIDEYDEANNYIWVSEDPYWFSNGEIIAKQVGPSKARKSLKFIAPGKMSRSRKDPTVREKYPNAYTPEEIRQLINYHKKTGKLYKKPRAFRAKSQSKPDVVNPPEIRAVDEDKFSKVLSTTRKK